MKNIYLPVICLICSSFYLTAQPNYWKFNFFDSGGVNAINSSIIERENTFAMVSGKILVEDSYYLEIQNKKILPVNTSFFESHYFYLTEIENNGNPFLFTARRGGEADGDIYISTLDKAGNIIENDYPLPDNLGDHEKRGPAAVQVSDESVLIFGKDFFYKVAIQPDGEISEEWSKEVNYGLIADAAPFQTGFILCTEEGKLIHVDENGDEVWQTTINYPTYSVLPLSDGILLTGIVSGQGALIKTDLDGEIIWEKQYDAFRIVGLDFSNEDGFVFTGENFNGISIIGKTDSEGELIWNKSYETGTGVTIIRSKFGGYLAHVKEAMISRIFRIDENGEGAVEATDYHDLLDVNKVSAPVSADGVLFWKEANFGDIEQHYVFPKGSNTTTMFSAGLWMSGVDQNGELHNSFSQYFPFGFNPGPIGADHEAWDNVWNINQEIVNQFRNDFADGTIDRPVYFEMLTYPGAGNPHFNYMGEPVEVPENMAPFIDVNNDGIYNLFDGDYPDVKGDEMTWWVMHDVESVNTQIVAPPFDVEIKGTFYAYGCGANPILDNATFLEYEITNYSDNDYSDLHLGTFVDYDLGCYTDDYIGTLVSTNSVYAYNEDETDGEPGCSIPSFPDGEIPIQSITYLNTSLDYSMYYDGSFTNYYLDFPHNKEELHNFMQATWRDGVPLTEGGDGYGGTTEVDYAFPGNPANPDEWSICTIDSDVNDRRMISVTGPKTLASNETLNLSIGFLTHENIDLPCPDISDVEQEIMELQNLFDSGQLDYELFLGADIELEENETIVLDAGAGAVSYIWSTGATSQSIEVSMPGTYSVTVTTIAGCEYTDEVIVESITSLSEVQLNAPKIYPNPATNQVFIEIGDEVPIVMTLENTLGQSVRQIEVAPGAANTTYEINTASLAQGMYLLRFHYQEKGKMYLRKLVISK